MVHDPNELRKHFAPRHARNGQIRTGAVHGEGMDDVRRREKHELQGAEL